MSPTRTRETPGAAAAPAVLAVLLVAGGGMLAVLLTSLGLMPLFGEPELSLAGWNGADLALAARETLLIALPSAVIAVAAGMGLAALMLVPGRHSALLRGACAVVLALPHLVGATSVGLLLADGGVADRLVGSDQGTWPALVGGSWPIATVLELAWKESAFVALVVVAAVGPGHRARMEIASALGASPVQRWTRVLLPTASPAAGAAGLVVLVYSVGQYEVAWLLGRAYPEPLPVLAFRLFGSIDLLDRPAAAAAAATGSALALALALCVLMLLPRALATLTTSVAVDPDEAHR